MIAWELIDCAEIPGATEQLRLYRRDQEYSMRLGGTELMTSRVHGSEDALADLACDRVADRPDCRLLIGGLGMGYTLAAALRRLKGDARVLVAELVPAVITWNRGVLAELAGRPLEDPRALVELSDVAALIRTRRQAFDAVLLDVDNGPEGSTRPRNNWLYTAAGLAATAAALKPGGVLAVWSAGPDQSFTPRLRRAGFDARCVRVRARGPRGGARHAIWLAVPR